MLVTPWHISLMIMDVKNLQWNTDVTTQEKLNELSIIFLYFRKNGGVVLNNRLCGVLAVTRAFGDSALKMSGLTVTPEVKKVELRLSHKYLVVGSDGLWDYVDVK